ncbi:H-NS histone family protein [Roseicitreum antarcticum]|uniref:DNA-binding protein H-NS n=1 Tax=Roseicitreum antarcticum TaxID=564137 RepID=A0A1H2R8U2_9RHOB|nr:H-NS histone family protein [Roseicitreum antarcticum]SDW15827.1 DNA-binding protein H-NS [Roseicitreum antarcticum]
MTIDISSLSLKELKKLHKETGAAIETYSERKRQEALAELEAVARDKGYTLAELTGVSGKKKPKPVVAKYSNPTDPTQKWSGRGRKPRWVTELLASGKTLSDIEI